MTLVWNDVLGRFWYRHRHIGFVAYYCLLCTRLVLSSPNHGSPYYNTVFLYGALKIFHNDFYRLILDHVSHKDLIGLLACLFFVMLILLPPALVLRFSDQAPAPRVGGDLLLPPSQLWVGGVVCFIGLRLCAFGERERYNRS